MSILNYFKKMLGFQTQETTPDLPTVETAVVSENTCKVERIYEISPEPLKMEVEPAIVNQQITDAVTQKEGPKKAKKKVKVAEENRSEATPKATVGEIKSGAKKSGKK
jgi:hypothetical protein